MSFVHTNALARSLLGAAVVLWCAGAADAKTTLSWFSPELRRLDSERRELEQKLTTLPPAPTPEVTERLGYHSGYSTSADTVEWVELDLHHIEAIDAIAIIPAAPRVGDSAADGYGFPVRFRVEFFDELQSGGRELIADFTHEDFPNPGILPVYLPTPGKRARFVRITATRLYREDNRFLCALGEVMLLQGRRNIATKLGQELRQKGLLTSRSMGALPVWGLVNIVDGHSVLGAPEGVEPSPTLGYQSKHVSVSKVPEPPPSWVQVDLGSAMPVDEVRLFPAHPPEYAHRPGFGYPRSLKVELSNDPEFRDGFELSGIRDISESLEQDPVSPGDNAVSYSAHGEAARYVRVTAQRFFAANGSYNFALSELQVWSGDHNAALHKTVTASDPIEEKGWSLEALVDGFTSRANILDWPEWLAGLSQRRETIQRIASLEAQRNAVTRRLIKTGWWLAGGVVAAGLLVLLLFNLRQRRARWVEMEALRQRISQDLHDEIGSSLGSIALISQDMIASGGDAAHMRDDLKEIQDIARETVDAMRDIVRLVQSNRYGQGDFADHLGEAAARALRGIPHTVRVETGDALNRLPMDRQRDLMLMFKESLHNIVRHAEAKTVSIHASRNNGFLELAVQDDGRGFDASAPGNGGMGLMNLHRRAAKLGGAVRITSAPGKGATLVITIPAE